MTARPKPKAKETAPAPEKELTTIKVDKETKSKLQAMRNKHEKKLGIHLSWNNFMRLIAKV